MRNNMKRISFSSHLLKEPVKSKAKHGYEALGEEIRDYFKCKTSQFWFLFYQVEEWRIRKAFEECKRLGKGVGDLIKFSKSIK